METAAGRLVVESYGSLKLNQELISQMFLQIQMELNRPDYSETSGKLEAAEEKIADMKKGVWSY